MAVTKGGNRIEGTDHAHHRAQQPKQDRDAGDRAQNRQIALQHRNLLPSSVLNDLLDLLPTLVMVKDRGQEDPRHR